MIKEGATSLERTKRMMETLRTIYGRSKTASETKGQKRLKDFAMKLTIIFWQAKSGLIIVMCRQQHTKIIITYIRRKIVANNTFNTFIGFMIDNIGFQYFNGWESFTIAFHININRNDVKFN